jgi:hypothetical protein
MRPRQRFSSRPGSIATALAVFVRAGRWQTAGDQIRHPGICAPAVPRVFRGTEGGRPPNKLLILLCFWWAHKGSNLGPLPCEGNALPLSYAPGILVHDQKPLKSASDRAKTVPEPAIYEVRAYGVKLSARRNRRRWGPGRVTPSPDRGFARKRCFVEADQCDLPRPVLFPKIYPFPLHPNQIYIDRRPVPQEGRLAIVTDAGRDAMDAGGVADERRLRRTAKSCGPDAPTLASSCAEAFPRGDGGKQARSPGSNCVDVDR